MMRRSPIEVFSLTSHAFAQCAASRGLSRNIARDVYRDVYRRGCAPDDGVGFPDLKLGEQSREAGALKFTLRDSTGLQTESVILYKKGSTGRLRHTLCMSSQIGCAMGCDFCETAQMGLVRQLTATEIVMQWFIARHELNHEIDNIVFMGMGEPMDNLDAVLQAVRVLADQDGAAIAPSNITVSTVGHVPGIRKLTAFADEPGFRQVRLAVSINAPNDAIRTQLMPINRAYSMSELMDAMRDWTEARANRRILIEYVLIPGVNDDTSCARQLANYLSPLNCTVNVIAYNPRRDSPWPAPNDSDVARFIQSLHELGLRVRRRQTLGRSLMAACGQLGHPAIRNRKFVHPTVRS